MGVFGWLAGDLFTSQGGISNAGLRDQRLAIAWVHKYISLFGGDPEHVTLMGESAGGGSIIFHITAYGGNSTLATTDVNKVEGVDFHAAVVQSPGWGPGIPHSLLDYVYEVFLSILGVNNLEEARNKSWSEIWDANDLAVHYGLGFGMFPL